ncbi:MAG TPA: sodium-dependent bicarbonate transport family permease, partial [Tepidisphaeraceae bacterium]|nr:sodium-dependent bicarbonate transport family permease [Tepidisphaeraceae bacterium]
TTTLSIYLLLAIGLKGGHELAMTPLAELAKPIAATLVLGTAVPLVAYAAARRVGGVSVADAAALAAHYGSVSAVTFAASLSFLDARGIRYEGFMPALVAILEVPAIVIALAIARIVGTGAKVEPGHGGWQVVAREVLTGRSIILLLGGLAVGAASTGDNLAKVTPLFTNLFYGVLVLFMLDMGMTAATRLKDVGRSGGWFLLGFGVAMPIVNGLVGVLLAHWAGMSLGGTTVLGVMAASASYIAAPAAVRVALPEANPGMYLTAAIGITFPFNLCVGIPLVYGMARLLNA